MQSRGCFVGKIDIPSAVNPSFLGCDLIPVSCDTAFLQDAHGRAPGEDFHETVATPLKVAVSAALR